MSMVSIIIPAYNCEKWLPACLESVRAQTYKDWQAIIVDDGSTDHTGIIADDFANKDSRFTVIHQKNGGSSVARNAGLERVTGEYVYMLDGDDRIAPQLLEHCLAALEPHPEASFVTFDFVEVQPNESAALPVCEAKPQVINDVLLFWLKTRRDHNVWTQVYRTSSLKDIRFKPGIKHQDLLLHYQYLSENNRGIYLPEKLYQYVLTVGSIMRSPLTIERIETIFDIITELDEYTNDSLRQQTLLRKYLYPRIINTYRKAVLRTNLPEVKAVYKKRLIDFLENGRLGFRGFSFRKKLLLLRFVLWHCPLALFK